MSKLDVMSKLITKNEVFLNKLEAIKKFIKQTNFIYTPFDEKYIDDIYDILINKNIKDNYDHGLLCHFCGVLFFMENNLNDAKKYYLKAIEKGNERAMNNYAQLLEIENKKDEAKKYYLMAIEKEYDMAMNNYAYMLYIEGKIDEAKKYCLMSIEKGNYISMNNYANILYKEGKTDEAKKYCLMSIEKGNKKAMNNYANMLFNEGKIDEAKKYYLLAIEKGCDDTINNYKLITNSKIEQYYNLNKIINKSEVVSKYLEELKRDPKINILIRKTQLLSKIDNCPICFEENIIVIPLECVHYYCIECYCKIDKCPMKCF